MERTCKPPAAAAAGVQARRATHRFGQAQVHKVREVAGLPCVRLRSHSLSTTRDQFRVPTWRVTLIGAILFPIGTIMLTVIIPDVFQLSLASGYALALVGLSLVPLAGYSGQISLAQMSFAGIGAVVMGNLGVNNPILGVVVAVLVAATIGALVSLPALRLSGIYLALLTAAFALMLSKLVLSQQKVMPQGNLAVPPLVSSWNTATARIIVSAVAFTLVGIAVVAVRRSGFGRRLMAMKDSPDACATLGLNLTRTNVYVFALSSGIAGLAGALWASTAQAEQFTFENSLAVTMLAVVGGVGLVGGAFFGGLLLGAFQSILGPIFNSNALGYFSVFSISMIVAQIAFSATNCTASGLKRLRMSKVSAPTSATAAPSTKLSTWASRSRLPAARLCFMLGAPAGSASRKVSSSTRPPK